MPGFNAPSYNGGRTMTTMETIPLYCTSRRSNAAIKGARTRKTNQEKLKIDIECPSKRRDFNTWRKLQDHEWRRKEFLGYYLSTYVREFKKEDPLFITEGQKTPKQKSGFWNYSTIIERFLQRHVMTINDFKKYTIFAIKKCKEYSEAFPDTKWFFTIYCKENVCNLFVEEMKKIRRRMI